MRKNPTKKTTCSTEKPSGKISSSIYQFVLAALMFFVPLRFVFFNHATRWAPTCISGVITLIHGLINGYIGL